MRTNTIKTLATKLLATSAIVALVAGAPATVDFDADLGGFSIKAGIALAKGGDSGSDDDGDSSGSGSDGDGGGDSSGPGSDGGGHDDRDDDDGDSSGPGSDGDGHDDRDDDDDDHDNSGPGSENSGRDDDHDDDDDDESSEQEFTTADGVKIEVNGDKIEVTYSDGWKEEIENGQYEMKDPAGNTVVERPATAADRSRLEAEIPG